MPSRNHRTYEDASMVSPRHSRQHPHAADESLMELMGQRPRSTRKSKTGPILSPRHDQPQVNLEGRQVERHYHKTSSSSKPKRSSSKKKSKRHSSSSRPHQHSYLVEDIDLDEASEEAHIVHKIEMAIKKSRSERRAGSQSQASSSAAPVDHHRHHHHHSQRYSHDPTKKTSSQRGLFTSEGSVYNDGATYELVKPVVEVPPPQSSKQPERGRKAKFSKHAPKQALETPPKQSQLLHVASPRNPSIQPKANSLKNKSKYKSGLIHLDQHTTVDQLSQNGGLVVDDKKGFQVQVNRGEWLATNFSDPTLDAYEHHHFTRGSTIQHGRNNKAVQQMSNVQRIKSGPTTTVPTSHPTLDNDDDGSSISGPPAPDHATSVIDRIYEKKDLKAVVKKAQNHHGDTPVSAAPSNMQRLLGDLGELPTLGDSMTSSEQEPEARPPNNGATTAIIQAKRIASIEASQSPAELLSFEHYEDDDDGDDGYYYEDEEDDMPIYPSSRPRPPTATNVSVPDNSILQAHYGGGNNNATDTVGELTTGDATHLLQRQLDEINQMYRDIQRQQEEMKKQRQKEDKRTPRPNETSAEAYQRTLARQNQAELHRLELVKKSLLLENQMELYRRSQEQWNQVRDMAIQEENDRRKIAEKAKIVWEAEMMKGGRVDNSVENQETGDSRSDITNTEEDSSENVTNESTTATNTSSSTNGSTSQAVSEQTSLYEKVASLNKLASVSDQEQKLIEAEILMELHLELSKQAAAKKILQKPKFLSGKLRDNGSGKAQKNKVTDANMPLEERTEELTRQIHELNLQMAPTMVRNKKNKSSHRKTKEKAASEKCRKSIFKKGLSNKNESKPKSKAHHLPSHQEQDEENGEYCNDDEDVESLTEERSEREEARDHEEGDEEPRYGNFSENYRNNQKRKKKKPSLKKAFRKLTTSKNHTPKEPTKRSAEIQVRKKMQPVTQSYDHYGSSGPKAAEIHKHQNDDDTEHEDPLESQGRDIYSQATTTSDGVTFASNPIPAVPDKSLLDVNSSLSTKLASNKIHIGVHGEAVEAMSVSGSTRASSTVGPSVDRYATNDGDITVRSGANYVQEEEEKDAEKSKKVTADDPSIFEYLEVEYYPHDEQTVGVPVVETNTDDAPADELNAYASKPSRKQRHAYTSNTRHKQRQI